MTRFLPWLALPGAVACGGKLAPLPGDAGHEHDASFDAEPDVKDGGAGDADVIDTGPPPPITIAVDQNTPLNVASDGTNVYWTNYGTGGGDGFLVREAIGGGPQTRLVSRENPWQLVLSGGYIYWSAYGSSGNNGSISKIPVDGGTPTILASSQTYPWAIAVDDKNVYWTQQETMGGTVSATPIDAVGAPLAKTVVGDLLNPTGLTLHDGTLFWTDYDMGGNIFSVPTSGGNYALVAPPQDHPFAIVADDANVYWSTYEAVMSVPLGGGTPHTLAAAAQRIIALATDGKYVYWTDYYEGTVTEVSVKGGTPITLVGGQNMPYGVAVDDKHVFWTTYGDGTVDQMDKWP